MKCVNIETGKTVAEGGLEIIIDKLWKGDWLANGKEEQETENN